jgi:hypothetical protein
VAKQVCATDLELVLPGERQGSRKYPWPWAILCLGHFGSITPLLGSSGRFQRAQGGACPSSHQGHQPNLAQPFATISIESELSG